jgi:hypothetical protein
VSEVWRPRTSVGRVSTPVGGGNAVVHTVVDDRSRVAYAEIHDDETAATAAGVLRRVVSSFAAWQDS